MTYAEPFFKKPITFSKDHQSFLGVQFKGVEMEPGTNVLLYTCKM